MHGTRKSIPANYDSNELRQDGVDVFDVICSMEQDRKKLERKKNIMKAIRYRRKEVQYERMLFNLDVLIHCYKKETLHIHSTTNLGGGDLQRQEASLDILIDANEERKKYKKYMNILVASETYKDGYDTETETEDSSLSSSSTSRLVETFWDEA